MNEEEEKKKKQQPGNNERPVDNSVDASQQYVQGVVDAAQKSAAATAQYNADVQKANSAYQDVVGQILDYGEQLRKEKEEAELQQTLDGNKAAFGGVTQAVAALFNQHFVNKGASNQTYRDYASDWMKEADKKRQENKMRLDNIREKQRQAQMQIEQIKHANALQDAKNGHDAAMAQAQADQAKAQAPYMLQQQEEAQKKSNLQNQSLELQVKGQKQSLAQGAQNLENAKIQAKVNAARYGFDIDDDGNLVPNEEYMRVQKTLKSSNGGGNKPTAIPVVGPDGVERMFNLTYNQMRDIAWTHKDMLDDLPEAEKKNLEEELKVDIFKDKTPSQQKDIIMKYARMSQSIYNLFMIAQGISDQMYSEQPGTPADPDAVKLDEDGFPE